MQTQNKPKINIIINNEQPVTTSRNVASTFQKNHRDVLRAIDNLEIEMGAAQNWADLFHETFYTHEQNKQQYREVLMTKDGFALLAMGFTGKKAIQFKLAYIEQFNKMEQSIKQKLPGTYKEALLQLVEKVEANEQLQIENSQLKPKADYFDKYIKNKGVVAIGIIAENYGMTGNQMNKLLKELGVQYKQGGTWKLYRKYKGKGYTHMEGFEYKDSNGNRNVKPIMKWHPKGHHFIYELLKENNIKPTIEL